VCDTYGAGYYYIPGSNTCLSISGYVSVGFWGNGAPANYGGTSSSQYLSSFVYGSLTADARTQTEYGLLRSVATLRGSRGSSSTYGTTAGNLATVYSNTDSAFYLADAFIQLGGLTVGYAPSFFSATTLWGSLDTGTPGPANRNVNQLAYTASFGGGFLATVAIEDPTFRRTNPTALITQGGVVGGTTSYAGAVLPNFVAALRVEQGWGSAQINGALQEVRSYNGLGYNDVSSTLGFAVGGGLTVKLDSLAKGDTVALQATYTNGATGYLFNRTNRDGGSLKSNTWSIGNTNADILDFTTAGGQVQLVSGFSAYGKFTHYFTPTLAGALFAGYVSTSAPAAYTAKVFQNLTLGTNVVYTPVKGLDLGVEGYWQSLNSTKADGSYTLANTGYDSTFGFLLYAKRSF